MHLHTYRTLRDPHRCVSDEQRANERPGAFPEDEDRRQARAALAAWDRAVAAWREWMGGPIFSRSWDRYYVAREHWRALSGLDETLSSVAGRP